MNKFNTSSNNLLSLLDSFDRYELNKLQKFIESPYFNKSEKLMLLYQLLKIDVIKKKIKQKDAYFASIYPDTVYDDQKFRNLTSDLLNLVTKYLLQEEFEQDHQAKAIYLIDAVKKKQIKSFYEKAISTANKWMLKHKTRSAEYYISNYKLENSVFKLSSEFEKKVNVSKAKDGIDILKINDHLDYFYMIEKLRHYIFYLSRKTITKVEYDFPYMDKVLAIVRTYRNVLPPSLQIYYNIFKISSDTTDSKSYYILKDLIDQHLDVFSSYERNTVYSYLINFVVKQVNKGSIEFMEEYVEICISGIKSGAILEAGYLSASKFRNIVSCTLRLKRFQWTKDFIKDNIQLVEEEKQDNAYKYNMARYFFYIKDYKKLIETLREVEFDDNLYALLSKSMLLVAYYEQFEEEALMNFADSFNAYLRRTSGLTDKVRSDYKKLIKFIKILNKARYQPNLLPALKKDIINASALPSRQWFLEKLKDIKLPNE